MKAAIGACVVILLALMACQRAAEVVTVMPGQSVEVAHGMSLVVSTFDIEHYDNGKPRQYRVVGDLQGRSVEACVNHPVAISGKLVGVGDFGILLVSDGGWRLWLAGVVAVMILFIVWFKAGIVWMLVPALLFAANALCQNEVTPQLKVLQSVWGFLLASAIVLPILSVCERSFSWVDLILEIALVAPLFILPISRSRLSPALQSPFFIPHVGCYVFGYVLLLRAALGRGVRFAPLGFAFMTTGLILGAMWGQCCWGSWWSWDPKEIWSLATWLCMGFGIVIGDKYRPWVLRLGGVLVLMTLIWVNFSRDVVSLHSYSQVTDNPLR